MSFNALMPPKSDHCYKYSYSLDIPDACEEWYATLNLEIEQKY